MKSAVIIGGGGALGKGMVQRLKKSEWNIINIDFVENEVADRNFKLSEKCDWKNDVDQVTKKIQDKVDLVMNAAGGWTGGRIGDKSSLDGFEMMWKMNMQSAILASHVAANTLSKNGLVVLTGAMAAKSATPDMAAYGMSKAATHHLLTSLSATLKKPATALAVLPVTIDTPTNRQFMANENFNNWTKVDDIAEKCLEWQTEREHRPPSGSLVSVITIEGKNNWTIE